MSHKELARELNRLMGRLEVRSYESTGDVRKLIVSDASDGAVGLFGSESVDAFVRLAQDIWASEDGLHRTVSLDTVRKKCTELLTQHWVDKSQATENQITQVFSGLLDTPLETFEVFRSLKGATLTSPEPLKLGKFTVYDWEAHKPTVFQQYPHAQTAPELLWDSLTNGVKVSVVVPAREVSRAMELADEAFARFQNAVRYMTVWFRGRHDVGFTGFRQAETHHLTVLSPTQAGSNATLTGSLIDVDLSDSALQAEDAGHKWIWNAMSSSHPTEIQQRVLSAVDWVGMAVQDYDTARSFVQIIFALEALLTFQEKGILVSPSVASQISEFAAFIMADTLSDRLAIEGAVKDLYSLRSKVAHGGSLSIPEAEVRSALFFIKILIQRLTTHKELRHLSSMKELRTWVQGKKYSGA